MVLFFVLVVVLCLVGIARALHLRLRRSPAASHHKVLDALDAMTRDGGPVAHPEMRARAMESHQHVRLVASSSVRRGRLVDAGGTPHHPPVGPAAQQQDATTDLPGAAEQRMVAPPTRPAPVVAAPGANPSVGAEAVGGATRRAQAAGRRPGRDLLAPSDRRRGRPAAVVGAVAAVVVVAVAVNSGAPSHLARSAAPRADSVPARAPAVATQPSAQTTVPPAASLVSSSPGGSTYSLRGAGATITFTATAASWTELRSGGPAGPVVYEGTLEPGQSERLSGSSWARLGNPTGVVVAVDGTPLVAPSTTGGQPVDMDFT